ncbi:MAG: T9SS type A sorting domain-containing protein [Crocinitomicaceae bacterium]|nr:T9SS type A sorting domain-containing protein [Crocinitomicaceae bacterium]
MKRITLVSLFFISSFLYSQAPFQIEWQKSIGGSMADFAYSIEPTSDGGFIVAGNSQSNDGDVAGNHGQTDVWVVKLYSDGQMSWKKTFGGSSFDGAHSIKQTADGGFIIAGYTASNDNDVSGNHGGRDFWILKLDSFGNMDWQNALGGNSTEVAYTVEQTSEGGYIAMGYSVSQAGDVIGNHGETDIWVVKLDESGNITWQKCLGGSSSEQGYDIKQTTDGGYIVAGSSQSNDGNLNTNYGSSDYWIVKLDTDGNIAWEKSYGGSDRDVAHCIKQTNDGGFLVSGISSSSDGDVTDVSGGRDYWIIKIDPTGNLIWQKAMGGDDTDVAYSIDETDDGGAIVAGFSTSTNGDVSGNHGDSDYWIIKLDNSGNYIWQQSLGGSGTDEPSSIQQTPDGGFIIAGYSYSEDGDLTRNRGSADYWVVKLEEVSTAGTVYYDADGNCLQDVNENEIAGINLLINPGGIVATTDYNGDWWIKSLPQGNYTMTVDTSTSWKTSCIWNTTQSFTISNPIGFNNGPDFGMLNNNPCREPDVSIYMPFMRPCFEEQIIFLAVSNANTATGSLIETYVEVELDPFITLDSASLSFTPLGNHLYRFDLDDVTPGSQERIVMYTTISCDVHLGENLCMEANLKPVEPCMLDNTPSDPVVADPEGTSETNFPVPCTLPWDKSSLSVEGWCQNDSVFFSVTNTGEFGNGDMDCYSPLWVTRDGIVIVTDSIALLGGETAIYAYPGNGQLWKLMAEQHPLHPGNSHPNAGVEECGAHNNDPPVDINDTHLDDADPVVDAYCGVVTGSYDPNDKTGYPRGETDQFYIPKNQQLQYVVRFQNTGTDTAFTVVVRDTLDFDLDIFSVVSGVSSHSYTFKMYGPRVLEWTFNDINLPDSAANQIGSNGFLTYHVEQVRDLEPGVEITNDADIYFDKNLPITTNTTIHRIYEGFVSMLGIQNLEIEGKDLMVYPNPTSQMITIQSEDPIFNDFQIYDQMGRSVYRGALRGFSTEVSLQHLSKGSYIIQVSGTYKPTKLVKE